MQVIKRDGRVENFNFDKVKKVIEFAIKDKSMLEEFLNDLQMNLKNHITTEEIQNTLIKLASEKITIHNTEWQFVASKLLAYDLYKQAGLNRGYKKFGYGNFEELIKLLTSMGLYTNDIINGYSKKEINELGHHIKPERDDLFTYAGLTLLANRFLVKGFNKEVLELPQERLMIIAMHNALNEPKEKRLEFAKKLYDKLSLHKFMTATPTTLNSGKTNAQMSSCFIIDVEDDLWNIYDTNQITALLSKHAGGIGLYVGRIRSRGSAIQGYKGASNGVINWLKGFENTAISCNQLGARAGAFAVYLDIWHADVMDFLELRTNGGDEHLKAHKLHNALCVPDLFMKVLEERGNWYLFDPHEIQQIKGYRLEDFFGEEFEKRYWDCVSDERFTLKKEIPAIKIWTRFLQVTYQKGEPYLFFRDTANKFNTNRHVGNIYSSNLCNEIYQPMKHSKRGVEIIDWESGSLIRNKELGEMVVCNLSSLHLGRVESEEDMAETISVQIRALDNVIDLMYYPVLDAEYSNKRLRAIGAGQMSYHEYLATKGIQWESQEHLDEVDKLYENIAYYTIKASHELAKEKGAYPLFKGSDWESGEYFVLKGYVKRDENGYIQPIAGKERWYDLCVNVMKFGIRNGFIMATAPTGTISILANATATTDPIFGKIYMEGKGDAAVPVVAPSLNAKTMWYYKDAHLIDQIWSVKAQGVRQKHIDQGNSFNIYVKTGTSAKELYDIYMEAWKNGLKGTYYMRTKTLTVEECQSCT